MQLDNLDEPGGRGNCNAGIEMILLTGGEEDSHQRRLAFSPICALRSPECSRKGDATPWESLPACARRWQRDLLSEIHRPPDMPQGGASFPSTMESHPREGEIDHPFFCPWKQGELPPVAEEYKSQPKDPKTLQLVPWQRICEQAA